VLNNVMFTMLFDKYIPLIHCIMHTVLNTKSSICIYCTVCAISDSILNPSQKTVQPIY